MEEIYANVEYAQPVDSNPLTNQTDHDSVRGSAADLSTIKANLTKVTKVMERLQLSSQQKKSCPAGWILFSSSCYLLSEESASWDESRQDCRDKGSDLVIVDTLEEQEFLSSIIRKLTWIGLSDRDNEGTWIWIDGTPLSDTVKYWNEPNNGGGHPQSGEQDCVQIVVRRNPRGNWNDLRCDKSRQWICEKLA
ncbi:CD209 antigen-like protein E [Anoplopoma fimbria]|uniref:CD209 antigen-like protein E n=1 Tax=Anoplopoma fimbria TaxID=229290 RepID=UPI0023ED6F1F|nr:CD209 antigen-like protein E [Anoplopoma fimbria]